MRLRYCPKGHLTGYNTEHCPMCQPLPRRVSFETLIAAFGGMLGLEKVRPLKERVSRKFSKAPKKTEGQKREETRELLAGFKHWRKRHQAKREAAKQKRSAA